MSLRLDPELRAAFEALTPSGAELPVGEWEERRRRFNAETAVVNARRAHSPGVVVEETTAAASDGVQIPLRIYRGDGSPSGGTVLYLHGGGHFCCDIDASDPNCRRYAADAGIVVVSVDYRFAPEHPYPAALEDAYAALRWSAAHVARWGGHADRLAVMGDSAGGGMAAGLALMARDRGGPALAAQVLVYPMLDDRTVVPDPEIAPLLTWGYADNATGWAALLGDVAGTAATPADAAPARAVDLRGLPDAYIEVGQLDAFRDEDVAYALALSRAGVAVELHVHPGAPHDFDNAAPDAAVSRRAFADRARVLGAV